MNNGKAKLWQMAVIIGGFAVASVVLGYQLFFSGDDVRLTDTITLVDVNTGEVFQTSIADRGYLSPGRNPKTGSRSLMPIGKSPDDGKWYVGGHQLSSLGNVEVEVKAVDKQTGEVLVEVGAPISFPHPSKWGDRPPLAP